MNNDQDDNQQHVIELDEFELNAEAEADADNSENQKPDGDENSDDSAAADDGADKDTDKSDDDNADDGGDIDDESDDDDSGNDDDGKIDQEKIDKIVSARLKQQSAKHELALEQERQERERVQRELDDLKAHSESEAQRQKELSEALEGDNLADPKVKDLAKPKEYNAPVHATGVQRLGMSDPATLQFQASQLDLKMQKEWGDEYQMNAIQIAQAIQGGVLHSDILKLANQHPNGTAFLSHLINDEGAMNQMALLGYQAADLNEYSLKFNELASNLTINSDDQGKKEPKAGKKPKPEPNKTLKQAPSSRSTIDDDVVYID